ncbi:EAL domain-containing response regulator [Mongoliimonas terrestris]|uniref:EAL domain-containing response regulator n=1 Tax=Mongoliimonas terrestris TaxID=1709001 RepID=UPI0009498414|nr:EAL domain-containing protein [Mongoliimonas terrestris]
MTTIVIVDDQITNQKIFAKMAATIEPGVAVVTFGDAREALAYVTANVPDLVVTDYEMPHTNGADFIGRMRAVPDLADVPVIVVTVFEERSFRLAALDAGATDFLQSPVDRREFAARARNLLKLRRQQQELETRAVTLEKRLHESERTLERAIRDSSERLAQVIDTVPAMVSATDRFGRLLFMNGFQARLIGVDPDAVAGRRLTEIHGEEKGERAAALDRMVMGKGEAIRNLEEEVIDADGIRRWFLTSKSPLRDAFDRIAGVVTSSLEITERKATETHLHYIAHHDPLTGLPNRTALTARLRLEVARARRGERTFALHLIDLDQFKGVNDVLGHPVGDSLLGLVADRLRGLEGEACVVSRLGGDEFAVLQTNIAHMDAAADLGRTICALIGQPFRINETPISTSASVGIAVFPHDGTDYEELFRNADLAMYRAKGSGGGRYCFYASDMSLIVRQSAVLDQALRDALERDEFRLYYQPQVDARTNAIVGAEALIRWQRPDGRIETPVSFLRRAEENGMMLPISAFVMREACRQAAEWRRMGLPPLRMSINVSPVQFQGRSLPLQIASLIGETGIDPRLLDLELTETTVMDDLEAVAEQLSEIRQLGVTISIDDFGTGFSSLAYVKRFPADRLKIDQSFVRDLIDDPSDAAIVRAIVNLGHSLGMTVVAEGVETEAQAERLREERCDELQGYHFGRPVPPDAFTALFGRASTAREGAGGTGAARGGSGAAFGGTGR